MSLDVDRPITSTEPGEAIGHARLRSEPNSAAKTFAEWWEQYGEPYRAAVVNDDGVPWPEDPAKLAKLAAQRLDVSGNDPLEIRKRLWDRRYQRPDPPKGLTLDLDVIRRKEMESSTLDSVGPLGGLAA